MNKILITIGLIVTTLYLLIFYFGIKGRLEQIKIMPLNELGDFFAGAFGPLAILWLVLGFFQQGKELKQNTEALQLQAEELKNSVIAQKDIASATKQQYELSMLTQKEIKITKSESLEPKFIIINTHSYKEISKNSNHDSFYMVKVTMKNVGNIAENIEIFIEDPRLDEIFGWHHHCCITNDNIEYGFRIKINYEDKYKDVENLSMTCTYDYEENNNGYAFVRHHLINIESDSIVAYVESRTNIND